MIWGFILMYIIGSAVGAFAVYSTYHKRWKNAVKEMRILRGQADLLKVEYEKLYRVVTQSKEEQND